MLPPAAPQPAPRCSPHLSLHALVDMMRAGTLPNDHIFPSAAKSCAALSDSRSGGAVHSLAAKTGFDLDIFVASSLLFDEMPEKNIVSWSGMIYGYAQIGMAEEALALFKMVLLGDGVSGDMGGVNDFTYSCIIRVCGGPTFLELGRQIHGHCFKTSFDSSCFVGSSLISLYSKCGAPEEAHQLFDEMPTRNLGAWNSILIACAQHGRTRDAFAFFERMKMEGVSPNFVTFLCLLSACSHAGLVEEGKKIFHFMAAEHRIQPGPEHYACMVDLLGRAGRLPEAVEFIDKMPVEPTDAVWGALLTGCRLHGDTGTAALAAGRLFEKGSTSSGAHMLLAAAAEEGDGAELGGVGNQVHTFVSGDQRHPLRQEIYEKVAELAAAAAAEGYVADTRFGPTVRGWRSLSRLYGYRREAIRVMKNLRVCGDCHTWLKHVSGYTGRTVILRDNNRFHRLDGGSCSCGDYW
ncbi:unnamed protein product [Spirodela intermedia]|uniref:DYW domain-containing protein n=1 Tax=Spirodela intermedia TaxID=51605 RepID=A0A7I8I7V0_SPIIN|nr:unnamed protein product [Spirodela intermedia]CAA6653639.1 unnamed protein product [Spirodela intermedia]